MYCRFLYESPFISGNSAISSRLNSLSQPSPQGILRYQWLPVRFLSWDETLKLSNIPILTVLAFRRISVRTWRMKCRGWRDSRQATWSTWATFISSMLHCWQIVSNLRTILQRVWLALIFRPLQNKNKIVNSLLTISNYCFYTMGASLPYLREVQGQHA